MEKNFAAFLFRQFNLKDYNIHSKEHSDKDSHHYCVWYRSQKYGGSNIYKILCHHVRNIYCEICPKSADPAATVEGVGGLGRDCRASAARGDWENSNFWRSSLTGRGNPTLERLL